MNAYENFITEIRDNIASQIKADLDAMQYAHSIAAEIDYSEASAHIEVRGLHTKTGAPHTFTIEIPTTLRENGED